MGRLKAREVARFNAISLKALQQINEVPFEENQIEFYVYTNDFNKIGK